MMQTLSYHPFRHFDSLEVLHLLVLTLSLLLVGFISYDTFTNKLFLTQPSFLELQFWVCIVFMTAFFVELSQALNKRKYLLSRWILFVVSIPYLTLTEWLQWRITPDVGFLLRLMPLIRGGYALTMVVTWFTRNRVTSLLATYLILLFSIIYFASLIFYVSEAHVNPLVHTYGDAVWWAFMNATTVGCNIVAVTFVGKVLSVLLASAGLLMFPIFTVYITNLFEQRKQATTPSDAEGKQ